MNEENLNWGERFQTVNFEQQETLKTEIPPYFSSDINKLIFIKDETDSNNSKLNKL